MNAKQLFNSMCEAMVGPEPEEQDIATPYTLGLLDYVDGNFNPPPYSTRDYDDYLRGWNNEWARQNGRTLLR